MARSAQAFGFLAVGILGAVVVARRRHATGTPAPALPMPIRARPRLGPIDCARRVNWATALLASSVLIDSGIEHYRGSFHNKAMYVPLGVATLMLAASLSDGARRIGSGAIGGAALDRLALGASALGTCFHFYNIAKRPGGICWLNLFYAAPFGAPAALFIAGLLRRVAQSLSGGRDDAAGMRAGRFLAGLVSVGLVGASAEAGLLHFRGAYHNPFMVVPVTLPPIAAALLVRAALTPGCRHDVTRRSLRLLAAAGLSGTAFHAYGIQRSMGGWGNWSQNLLNGPPLPAPPSFTALAMAGEAALDLVEEPKA